MDKIIGIFRRQTVYSAFLSTLVVASLAIAYTMFVTYDTKVHYLGSQVKGETVTRPVSPETTLPPIVTIGKVRKRISGPDESTAENPEVTDAPILKVVKTPKPVTTKKPKNTTTTTTQETRPATTTTITETTIKKPPSGTDEG